MILYKAMGSIRLESSLVPLISELYKAIESIRLESSLVHLTSEMVTVLLNTILL